MAAKIVMVYLMCTCSGQKEPKEKKQTKKKTKSIPSLCTNRFWLGATGSSQCSRFSHSGSWSRVSITQQTREPSRTKRPQTPQRFRLRHKNTPPLITVLPRNTLLSHIKPQTHRSHICAEFDGRKLSGEKQEAWSANCTDQIGARWNPRSVCFHWNVWSSWAQLQSNTTRDAWPFGTRLYFS